CARSTSAGNYYSLFFDYW
nr:immunoglobulin heavy chain junction region [Macaca mulatta]